MFDHKYYIILLRLCYVGITDRGVGRVGEYEQCSWLSKRKGKRVRVRVRREERRGDESEVTLTFSTLRAECSIIHV